MVRVQLQKKDLTQRILLQLPPHHDIPHIPKEPYQTQFIEKIHFLFQFAIIQILHGNLC